MAVITLQI